MIEPSFGGLIGVAKAVLKKPFSSELLEADEVAKFLARIEKLYADMGNSLRVKPVQQEAAPGPAAASLPPPTGTSPANREADFRGVVCPLNYVKTKLLLGGMKNGSVLSILLDEPGSRNVPASIENDGHQVLSLEQEQGHWRLLVRKA